MRLRIRFDEGDKPIARMVYHSTNAQFAPIRTMVMIMF